MRKHFIAVAVVVWLSGAGASLLLAKPGLRAPEVIVLRGTGRDGAHLGLAVPVNILSQLQQPGSGSNINLNQIGGTSVSSSLYDAGNTALKVNCVVGCSATGSFTDNSAFTTGSTAVTNISGLFNDAATNLTSGNAGALRATTDRMLFVNLGKLGGTALSGANVVDAANTAFRVNCVTGCSASAGFADNSAFTAGSTTETNIGGVFNDGLAAITSGNAAAARITSSRAVHVNLRNSSGTEIGTSATPVRVDPTGTTTQPVSGTVTANAGTGTFTVGGTVTANQGTANAAPWNENLAQIAGTNTVTGGVAGLLAAGGNAASGAADSGNPVKTGCVFNTTQPTVTTGQRVDQQCTSRGAQIMATGVDAFTATVIQATASNLNAQVVGNIASGSADSGNPVLMGGVATGNRQRLILCDSSAVISTATSGSTQLVALTSGQTIYICGYNWMANGAVNVKLLYGTGTNCATGPTDLTGAYNHTAQTGIAVTSPSWTGIKTAASNALCVNLSAAVQVSGVVMYTKF